MWSKFDAKFAMVDNSSIGSAEDGSADNTLAALAGVQAVRPLVVIGMPLSSILNGTLLDNSTADYWRSRWEQYKHVYAFSRYLWVRNITNIEVYNEPDLDSSFNLANGTLYANLWTDTMAVCSRAVQDAYLDYNSDLAAASRLAVNVHVGAFAKTTYGGGNLGQPSALARRRNFAHSGNDPAWANFQTYSYHSYGQTGKIILSNFNNLLNASAADRAAVGNFSFALTEFNSKTSGDYSTSPLNTDMASEAARVASQAINLASAGGLGLAAIYVFKFSITVSSNNGVAKNGIHWGDNLGAPFNIGDATLSAEAVRLIAERLAGSKPLMSLTYSTTTGLSDTKALGVKDGGYYYIYFVNNGLANVSLTLALSSLGVGAGWPVVIERVNASSYGEVTEVANTTSTGGVALFVGPDNLVRVKVPAAAPPPVANVAAAAAAHVRAGNNSAVSYVNATAMCVGTTTGTTLGNIYAAAMRFTVSNATGIGGAVLRLTLSSLSSNTTSNMPMLLLGFRGSAWPAGGAPTWSTLSSAAGPLSPVPPAGAAATWPVNSIASNFVNYSSPGLAILGHVTLPPTAASAASGTVKMVDITSFVRGSSDGVISLVLLRPFRNNLEKSTNDTMPADTLNGGATACFHSAAATNATNRPRLLVQYA